MGTASDIFLSELENCIDGAIGDAALRAAGAMYRTGWHVTGANGNGKRSRPPCVR